MTHIRRDHLTRTDEIDSRRWQWVSLCGERNPVGSVSERHMQQVRAGAIAHPNVPLCPHCLALLMPPYPPAAIGAL